MAPPPPPPPPPAVPLSLPVDPRLESWESRTIHTSYNSGADRAKQNVQRYPDRVVEPSMSGELEPIPREIITNAPSTVADSDHFPLPRFWKENGPWNPLPLAGGSFPQGQYFATNQRTSRQRPPYGSYPHPPKSDPGSHRISDSGYWSKSVASETYPDHSMEKQSLPGDIRSIQVQTGSNNRSFISRDQHDNQSVLSHHSNEPHDPNGSLHHVCEEPNCNAICKSSSELKYVNIREFCFQQY
jgi:hypothetical protein